MLACKQNGRLEGDHRDEADAQLATRRQVHVHDRDGATEAEVRRGALSPGQVIICRTRAFVCESESPATDGNEQLEAEADFKLADGHAYDKSLISL